jgi:dTDP-4-amino-4,6-dideoxygalactose transaminase
MAHWRIPLSDLDLGREEQEAVARVVGSGWLTLGPEVRAFEEAFAAFCGADRASCVSSGTAALHLACLGLGVTTGVEVIVPSLTFVASANAVALAGGRPVFAEALGPHDLTLDPEDVERRVTPATRGVMCVHYGGFACRMDDLLAICERHGLFLIEDAAHAPGGLWEGRALGSIGDAGCFSFFGNKNMTTGEGGMVLARDAAVLDRVNQLRSHGMTSMSWERFSGHAAAYEVDGVGYNYRPSELTGALGRVQLDKLQGNNARRMSLLDRYRERVRHMPQAHMPFDDRRGTAHIAVLLVERPELRDPLRRALAGDGIQTSVHYQPAHLFRHYREEHGYGEGDLPVTEDLSRRAVTLPLYATMTTEQVDEVCGSIESFLAAAPAAASSRSR